MPHSLRVRLKNLQRKGELTEQDIDRIFKALEQVSEIEENIIKYMKKYPNHVGNTDFWEGFYACRNVVLQLDNEYLPKEQEQTEEKQKPHSLLDAYIGMMSEQTEEIKVGDEVILSEASTWSGQKALVIGVDESRIPYHIMTAEGNTEWEEKDPPMKKTGRHFPQIAEVLEQMRKESE